MKSTLKVEIVTISKARHNILLEAERLVKAKRYSRVFLFEWGRRVVVKSNEQAVLFLADELAVLNRSAHYYARRNRVLERSRMFNILGRLCFGSKWKQMVR